VLFLELEHGSISPGIDIDSIILIILLKSKKENSATGSAACYLNSAVFALVKVGNNTVPSISLSMCNKNKPEDTGETSK
jgi:hypothetical protein